MSGKEKMSIASNTTSQKIDIKKARLNRFDAGLNVQASAIFSNFWFVGLSSDIGFSKVNSSGTISMHNQSSRVFIGLVF